MFTLDELARTIDQRAGASAEMSYTRSLLDKGPAHCARKFGEEAIELAIAAAALDIHSHDDVGTQRAPQPDVVTDDIFTAPLSDHFLGVERVAVVDGAREILLGAIDAVR